jgi:hypothetical protein
MKTLIKKILIYIFFTFIGLLIAAILLPFVFKSKLITAIKESTNDQINAIVDFKDADLSFIRSFPDVRVSIDSLTIRGIGNFDGITLYSAVKTDVDFNFMSLISKNRTPEINAVELEKPKINIVILKDKKENYNILKDTSSSKTAYHITLKSYKVNDGDIMYKDDVHNLMVELSGVNHNGKGDFTKDIIDLVTSTSVVKLSINYNGNQYIKSAKASLDALININFPEKKYTLNENKLILNELDLTGSGSVQMKDENILTDVTFATASEDFKSLLSMVPYAYTKDFANVQSKGKASFSGRVNGLYNGERHQYPAFDIKIKVDNGYIKYPTLPMDIKDIFADINIAAKRPDYKDMSVNIPVFSLKLSNDVVSGRLLASNLSGNQKVEGHIKGNLALSNLKSALPMNDVENLNGSLFCDLEFSATMDDINAENYKDIRFTGLASAKDIVYKSKGSPAIELKDAKAIASPNNITFTGQNIKMGKSDLSVDARVLNPLAVFSTEKNLKITVKATSSLIDLNEWNTLPTDIGTNPAHENQTNHIDQELLNNSSINLTYNAVRVLMDKYTIKDLNVDANLAANAMDIRSFSSDINGNDIRLSGTVINAWNYFFNKDILHGTLALSSNKFDANYFMNTVADPINAQEPMQVIPVPERVSLKVIANVKDLTYTNLKFKDFTGTMEIENEEVVISGMETKTLGGTIKMQGLYNTADLAKPDFSIKLDLSKIRFADAISSFEMFRKAAPVAEYLDGFFNTTLIMKGKLGGQMTPDLSSLDASGFIETLTGNFKGFNPLNELGNKLGINELKNLNLSNTKNWFEIIQGFVEVKEYSRNIKGIDITISGKHAFGKAMDYNLDLVIPREMMKKNRVTALAESGLSMLEKEASKLGIDINQGPDIFLKIKMTGTIKNPVFKITPQSKKGGTLGEAEGNIVTNKLAAIKDSLTNEIKKKETELKDTISKRLGQEVDKAKTKAEEAASKAIDSIKSKAKEVITNKIDTLTKGYIPDSLKQKAKDILDKKTTDEVDKIKDKLKDFNPFKKKGN